MHRPTPFPAALAVSLISLSCALTACDGNSQAFYTGTLQPQGGTCDPPALATLQVRNNAILFVPRNGTVILHGSVSAAGALHAEATLPGMDHKPYRLTFNAPSAQTHTIEGQYLTPRCAYVITLKKTEG